MLHVGAALTGVLVELVIVLQKMKLQIKLIQALCFFSSSTYLKTLIYVFYDQNINLKKKETLLTLFDRLAFRKMHKAS